MRQPLVAPNPRSGLQVRLLRRVEHIPPGATAVLIGSLMYYDEPHGDDEFYVEYRGALVSVRRADLGWDTAR